MAGTATRTARRELDRRLSAVPRDKLQVPRGGWVKAIRQALGMSGADLARRMGLSDGAVRDLERSEPLGTVSLDRLRRAAEAMNCELVYVIVPRSSLAQTVEDQARAKARAELGATARTMSLEAQDTALDDEVLDETWRALADTQRLWR